MTPPPDTTLISLKAHPIGTEAVPCLHIRFSEQREMYREDDPLPHIECQRRYREEADRLVTALEHHLPGGLLDAIFASFCARKASCLRVPDIDRTKGDPNDTSTRPSP